MDGQEPFGIAADFRFYPKYTDAFKVVENSIYTENIIDGLPDKFAEYINLAQGAQNLILLLKSPVHFVKPPVLKALGNLATKESVRGTIIRN
jgi:hypothetical protein